MVVRKITDIIVIPIQVVPMIIANFALIIPFFVMIEAKYSLFEGLDPLSLQRPELCSLKQAAFAFYQHDFQVVKGHPRPKQTPKAHLCDPPVCKTTG